MNPIKQFAIATAYVTRIPLTKLPDRHDCPEMAGLAKYLPASGLFIGAILLAVAWLLAMSHCPRLVSGAILTIVWLAITGGIHFDGLMDTADGIFSHRSRQRMLEIMADSRVGNFGAMVGFSTIILKFACLSSLSTYTLLPAFLLVPTWARWCETYAIGAFPYAKENGMGKIWHDTTRFPRDIFVAVLLPILSTAILQYHGHCLAAIVSACTIVCGLLCAYWLNHILEGQTGDTYGAVVELAETGALTITVLISSV